jgi:hypothetical protein
MKGGILPDLSLIDRALRWQRAYLRGYDLDLEYDLKRWHDDTYGRHDREFLGVHAISFGVTISETHNGVTTVPVYGCHRGPDDAMGDERWVRKRLTDDLVVWSLTRP